MDAGPLEGTHVLDFSIIYAGPYAGMHLADLGAQVTKVEQPGGDPFRHTAAVIPGNSKVFQYLNRGKRSIVINLRNERGREVAHRLVSDADVVLMNWRPGVGQRLGLDWDTLSSIRHDLIYGEITGWGGDGPLAGRAGTNIVAEAYGGAMALNGSTDEDGAPMRSGLTVGDMHAGLALAMAVSAALVHRERTGKGQVVSSSLLGAVLSLTGMHNMREPVSDAALHPGLLDRLRETRERDGTYEELLAIRGARRANHGGPYHGGFRAKDGAIVIGSLTQANFSAARAVLGIDDDPTMLPGFDAGSSEHQALRGVLRDRIRDIFLTRTVDEWVRDFQAAGVPVSPVNLPEELADDPHVSSMMVTVEHELGVSSSRSGRSPPSLHHPPK
jgi:formyl-CoA transferase